jgi:protein-disulfide isomerase
MVKFFLALLLPLISIVNASEARDNRDTHNHGINSPSISTSDVFALNEAPDDHVLGSNKAPITFIVWASVTCPHCSDWFSNEWPAFNKILVQTGKVRFIFRELPTQPAQLAMLGFMMAECAPSEKYFDLIEFQMLNQKEMFEMASKGEALSFYKKIGKMSGLKDDNDINVCMQTKEKFDHIMNNGKRAQNAGVSGVPSFYINGRNYNNELDAINLISLVEKMIERGTSDFTDLN